MVAEAQAGQRLDRFLAAQFPDMSRTHVQTLIDEGRVLVSGIAKKPSHHVESGEQITVEIPPPALPGVEAENIPLTLLYEDADIAVVNKPAGLSSIPVRERTPARWSPRSCISLARADFRPWAGL